MAELIRCELQLRAGIVINTVFLTGKLYVFNLSLCLFYNLQTVGLTITDFSPL